MSIKLLLADDSITIQKVVGIIFGGDDYTLTVVDNGKSAVEKAKEIDPDVLLIDALMPGMSGYEVCEAVRANAALAAKPILLLTGSFEPFDETKAKNCGADDFIAKPFESQQIVSKVKELFELGNSRAAAQSAPAPVAAAAEPAPVAAPAAEALSFADTAAPPASSPAVAAAPPFEPPAFAPAEPAASPFESTSFTPDFSVPETPAAPAAPAPETMAAPAIWDAFTPAVPEPAAATQQPATAIADNDIFAMVTDEPEPVPAAAAPAAVHQQHIDSPWTPVEEQTFEFAEEKIAEMPSSLLETVPAVDDSASFGDISFDTPEEPPVAPQVADFGIPVDMPFSEPAPAAPLAEPSAASFDTSFQEPLEAAAAAATATPAADLFATATAAAAPAAAFIEPAEPASDMFAPVAESIAAASAVAATIVEPAASTALTEEQLKAALASVSKDVIERIVWEVVPDLAEVLIKEAIRKIKEGI